MKKTKTLADLHTEIPNRIILDGTFFKLSNLEKAIYVMLCMYKNFQTNESWASYSTIRKHIGDRSGIQIRKAIERLNHEFHLIEAWEVPILKANGEESGIYKRRYRVLP